MAFHGCFAAADFRKLQHLMLLRNNTTPDVLAGQAQRMTRIQPGYISSSYRKMPRQGRTLTCGAPFWHR